MLATMLSLVVALAPGQAKTPNAEAILKAANAAGEKLKTVKYSLESKTSHFVVRSTVWQQNAKVPEGGAAYGLYRMKGTLEGSEGTEYFELSYDGKSMRIKKDSDDIKVLDNPTPFEAGQHTPMGAIYASLPLMGNRFGVDAKTKAKHVGTKKVGKWDCDVVEIRRKVEHPSEGEIELVSKWAFDKATHLPVQLVSDRWTSTLTSLVLNPKIEPSMFKMSGTTTSANRDLGPYTDNLLAEGSVAPDFTIDTPNGKWSLADHKGKVVVLDFWATYCVPCEKVAPVLEAIHEDYGDKGVEVLGISLDYELDPVAFWKRKGHKYELGVKGHAAGKTYRVELMPTVYVIDQEGKIAFRVAGIPEKGPEIVRDEVKKLVAES